MVVKEDRDPIPTWMVISFSKINGPAYFGLVELGLGSTHYIHAKGEHVANL